MPTICEIGKERIRRAGKQLVEAQQALLNEKQKALDKLTTNQLALVATDDEAAETLKADIARIQTTLGTLDTGFRVYRLDSSNMQDVYHRPQDFVQQSLDLFADNIKPDRTEDDLLAQVMLSWGLSLSLPIERATYAGQQVFRVAGNSLYACFGTGVDEALARALAPEAPLRVVFRDSGFKDDTAKINVQQLLKQLSPTTEMKVI